MKMKFINTNLFSILFFILIVSVISGCGRPGGKSEDNASGSYLAVTSVSEIQNDKVTIKVKNTFKDPSVTTPNSMYDVTIRSYALTYFRSDGSIILSHTNNNSIFMYLKPGEETQSTITLYPSPRSVSYSSASMDLLGINGFGDKIGTTFYIPTLSSTTTTTTTTTYNDYKNRR